MSDTETVKSLTIDELVAAGRLSFRLCPEPAAVSYVYLDGSCVGTMWVQLDDEVPVGYFEVCFDPHHKHMAVSMFKESLNHTIAQAVGGAGNWSDAEDALALKVVSLVKQELKETV
jgi:hypothetical protein